MSHAQHQATSSSRLALQATIHCLTGCGIGEIVGLAGGTVAFRVNRWLIARDLDHTIMHGAPS